MSKDDLPDQHLVPLAQLTSLQRLTLCYDCLHSPFLVLADVSALASLTNLRELMVKGVVPDLPQQQEQHRQACLPASLTSLVVEGHQELTEPYAEIAINQWLQHAAGCGNLQQLHLIDVYCGGGLYDIDFSGVPHLTELQYMRSAGAGFPTTLPASISRLVDLEVLWVGTFGTMRFWEDHHWQIHRDETLFSTISEQCPKLRRLGPLFVSDGYPAPPQPFQHLSHVALLDRIPDWLSHTFFPSLSDLVIEAGSMGHALLLQLAQLTGLSCLQLNMAYSYMEGRPECRWAPLDLLASGLSQLQRLELVNYCTEPATADQLFPSLTMPLLSGFTQLKQLRLACAVPTTRPLPEQLTAADLLRGLSGLTQLERLELIGYVAVTPAVVSVLIERLPKLLVLEVKRCEHPDVLVAPARDGAQGLASGLSDYQEVQELYRELRPKLRFEVLE
jgi:hypothetical protein